MSMFTSSSSSYDVEALQAIARHLELFLYLPISFYLSLSLSLSIYLSISLCVFLERENERDRERERRVCISRKSAASSSSDGWQPRTSPRTCKSARQRSSIDIQFLHSANKSLSHVHVHLLLLLLLSALSWPGTSDPAPYSCHPYPLYRLPILHLENVFDECNAVRDRGG